MLDNTPTTDGRLTGQGLGKCFDNRGTAFTANWHDGEPADCYALQEKFVYATVEFLFNYCTGAGNRLTYTNVCDERGFTDALAYMQGFFQWDITADWQAQSQDVNSPFYGMTYIQYMDAITTKYSTRASTRITTFTTFGVCPCSWVNDNAPTLGQPKVPNPKVNTDYYFSYAYVEYQSQYSNYFKVF